MLNRAMLKCVDKLLDRYRIGNLYQFLRDKSFWLLRSIAGANTIIPSRIVSGLVRRSNRLIRMLIDSSDPNLIAPHIARVDATISLRIGCALVRMLLVSVIPNVIAVHVRLVWLESFLPNSLALSVWVGVLMVGAPLMSRDRELLLDLLVAHDGTRALLEGADEVLDRDLVVGFAIVVRLRLGV